MKKLLLADDSVTIQRVIGIIFATEDYQLLVTDNGDDAYEKAEQELPDLVIADVSMPGKDGFELCQSLKSNPRFAKTSVMLLPGTFDHFDEERAQAVGADGWLSKPFESQALLDKVEQLLEAEPVQLTAAEAAPAEEAAEGFSEPSTEESAVSLVPPVVEFDEPVTESVEELAVDDSALGLAEVEETAEAKVEDDSAEDIWDAVSFDEDDLESPAAVAEEEPAATQAAETVETAEDMVFEEPALEDATELTEIASSLEESPAAEFVADEGEFEIEQPVAGLDAEDDAAEIMDLSDELIEEPASIEPLEFGAEPESAESPMFEEAAAEESELVAALADETVEESVLESELNETEPLELDEELVAEEPAEELLELSELDEEDEALPEVVAQAESELAEDEEILDLADEDILEEESLEAAAEDFSIDEDAGMAAEEVEEEAFAKPVDQVEELAAEPVAEPEESFGIPEEESIAEPVFEEPAFADDPAEPEESFDIPEEESIAEPALEEPAFADDSAEPVEELAMDEEINVEPEVEEDEAFFFDAAAADEDEQEAASLKEELAVAATGLAAGAVAATVATEDEPEGVSLSQVEQQLRELSEDELKEVVAKVAGPMIEKLANEMLEQIAWEVVPDLAESMIREEIRKIKQGAV